MQTRSKRQAPEDAGETEKPKTAAKKRGRPSSSASEEHKPAKGAKRSPSPLPESTAHQPSSVGRGRGRGKKSTQHGAPHATTPLQADTKVHESEMKEAEDKIKVNRAPVLTMWVAVVATREGYSYEEGLSFGKAIAGLLAQSKGRSLGLYEEPSEEKKEERKRKRKEVDRFPVFGMNVPGKTTKEGLRLAVQSGKPISPSPVAGYLHKSFGVNYDRAKGAMEDLANSFPSEEIGSTGYSLYEKFRPTVPHGVKGWGAKGFLDVEGMRDMRKV